MDVGSGITDFRSCVDLNQIPTPGSGIDGKSKLAGCGFRIRLKLPGKTDNIVLEQFNLRALVNSEQDGFGNNWDYEQFNSGSAYGNSPSVFQQQGTKGTFAIGSNSFDLQHGYPNFFSLPALDDDNVAGLASFLSQANSLSGVNLEVNAVVPKVSIFDSSIGFFHESDTLSPMESEERGPSFLKFRFTNAFHFSIPAREPEQLFPRTKLCFWELLCFPASGSLQNMGKNEGFFHATNFSRHGYKSQYCYRQ